MKNEVPVFKKEAFNCPHTNCGAFSQMIWENLMEPQFGTSGNRSDYFVATCTCCKQQSLWRDLQSMSHYFENNMVTPSYLTTLNIPEMEMIYPDSSVAPFPTDDMPNDVRADYEEAARVASRSPRAAAALLRLALQKLCVHLGQEGKNIDADIRALAKAGKVPTGVIKAADTMRLTGNNSVHPGEMNDEDRDHVALKMFELLNFIVEKAITEPKELEALYEKTPVTKRKAAEEKDAKARSTDEN